MLSLKDRLDYFKQVKLDEQHASTECIDGFMTMKTTVESDLSAMPVERLLANSGKLQGIAVAPLDFFTLKLYPATCRWFTRKEERQQCSI